MNGKLIIISAPSGSGKTTIMKRVLAIEEFKLKFSVSACSRKPRFNETDGIDYYFITAEEFRAKIRNNEFVEWEEVYKDNYYGTLRSEVDSICDSGYNVIFDVDVVGGLNIKHQYPQKSLALFIQAPSVEELEKRLRNRSTDNEETISKRVAKARHEMSYAPQFDRIIINDKLEEAVTETQSIISAFLKK